MLKKSIAWLLTLALCMSIFAGCGNKDVATDVPVDNTVVDDSVTPTDDTDSDTLVITTAGNVTPNAGVKNVVIEADGVILENASLDSITISPKLGDGTATLKNVKVKTLDANGGGEHSLIINDCEVVTLVANREEGKLHITISVGSTVKTFTISSEVLADIEGGVDNLVVEDTATDPKVNILATSRVKDMLVKALTQIKIDAKVDSVSVTGDAKGSEIEVTKDGKLTKLSTDVPVTTSGEGKIDELVTDDPDNLDGDLKPNETTIDEAPVKNNGAKPTPTPKVNASQKPYVKPSPTAAPTVVPTPTAPPIPSKPVDPVIPTTPPVLGTKASLCVDNITIVFTGSNPTKITSGTLAIEDNVTLLSAIMAGLSTRDNATYKIVAAGTTCTDAATYNALTAKKGTDTFATGDHIYALSQDGKELRNHPILAGKGKTLIDNSWNITVSDVEYTGNDVVPTITVKTADGVTTLAAGTDYELILTVETSNGLQDIVNVGNVKVGINGLGDYCGTVWKDFNITPKAITIAAAAKSCDGKVYDGNNNVTADNLDVTLDGVVGPALTKGTDYKVTGTFEDANVGVNKKINVAVTMLNTKAAKNFTLAPATELVTSTAAITPKAVGNKANKTTDSVVYNANGIDLAQFFTPDTKAGVASYEVATTQPDSGVGSVTGSTLTVTTCGKFTVTMKTAASADGNYAADTKGVSFVLTVEKTAGVAIAETLDTVKTTTIGGTDGKITGLSNAKLYEYKKGTDAYAKVAANATEITGLVAGTYTVRYQETNTVAAGTEKTITVADTPVLDLGVDNITITFIPNSGNSGNQISSGSLEIVDGKTLISAIMAGLSTKNGATYKIVAAGTTCTDAATYNALTAKKGTDTFATGDHVYVLSQDGKTLRNHTIVAGKAKTLIDDSWKITVPDVEYTGAIAVPNVTIEKGGETLILAKNYIWITGGIVNGVAKDNINVGTCSLFITGVGDYCGEISTNFKIVPKPITIAAAAKSCGGKVYDGNPNVTATDLDVDFTGVIGTLTKGTDYKVTGTFEDANVGVNKKINVAVTMLNTKAAKNFTLAPATKLVTSTAAITPKAVGNKANKTTDSVVYNANGIDLAQFFTPDTKAGVASYTVTAVAGATGGTHSSGNATPLVVTKCGDFTITMKTAPSTDGNYAAGTEIPFTLTVTKGTPVAPTATELVLTKTATNVIIATGTDVANLVANYEYMLDTSATEPSTFTSVAFIDADKITGIAFGANTHIHIRKKATATHNASTCMNVEINTIA